MGSNPAIPIDLYFAPTASLPWVAFGKQATNPAIPISYKAGLMDYVSSGTETITLEVSQDMLAALKMGATDLGERIRLLAAIAFFQEKQLSLGKAAELAGLNRLTFMDLLTQRGIVVFDYDESALATELTGIASLPHQGSGAC